MRKCSEEERKRSTLSCQFLGFYTHPKHFFVCVCAPKRFLRRGNKHSRPSHFRAKSTHAKRKKRTKKRERETERDERQRSLVVLVVRRKRRSLLFFDRKKKKKWNKIVSSAIGILAVGGKRISRIISRLVAFTASFETEKAERERTKTGTEYERVRSLKNGLASDPAMSQRYPQTTERFYSSSHPKM